jgi:hypothetical protein
MSFDETVIVNVKTLFIFINLSKFKYFNISITIIDTRIP